MSLKDWTRKKRRELEHKAREDLDTRTWHSGSYHRYFEGYQEYETVDEKGRRTLRRVYMGKVYRQELGKVRYVFQRVIYVLLLAGCIAAVVLAGIRQGSRATPFYSVLTEMATVCLLAWLGYSLLVNYLLAPKEMTIHDYRSSAVAVRKASFFLAIAFGADILMCLLELLLTGAGTVWEPLLFLTGGVCALVFHLMEKRVVYKEETPHAGEAEPTGSVTIENREAGL